MSMVLMQFKKKNKKNEIEVPIIFMMFLNEFYICLH